MKDNPQANRYNQEIKRTDNEEQPKALQNKINIEESGEVSLEKTTDILNQINAYLDEEKKNLNSRQ